jgi:hypothetical protein
MVMMKVKMATIKVRMAATKATIKVTIKVRMAAIMITFRKFFNFRLFERHNNDDNHKPDKKGDDNKVKVKEQDQAKIYKGYGIDPADGEGNNKKSFNFAAVGDFGCSKKCQEDS